MQKNSRLFRLTATVALAALLFETTAPVTALAQPGPPPLPAPGGGRPDLNQADPPARVGRIASMTGAVSFHNPGDTQWAAATPNYPVSTGNSFWTEPSAEARLEVSDSHIVMAGGTELDVSTLDVSGLQAVAAEGELYVRLRDLAPNEVWSMQTPRGLVRLSGDGRVDIVVGTTDQPTMVTVVDGAAQIDGPGVSMQVTAGQTATIIGTDSFQGSLGPAVRDAFLNSVLAAERPRPAPAVPPPPQVVAMCGGSDLYSTGTWSQTPEYGQVWYPPVAATWVPYREGHWAFVAPWGWTWVDDASWGFAPFHYGRWLQVGGRWGWTPGEARVDVRPVYAPALVAFIGIGAGVALGAAIASGSIGWVPLGPREAYHPWYHASSNYVREVNVSHVTNITNTNVTINNYVNRAAAISIPAAAMTGSRPVQAVARPVTPQEFAAARPVVGRQPILPTAATAGVTPVVARQLHLPPAAAAARPAAPGPVVRPQSAGFVRPALAPTGPAGGAAAGRQAPGVRPAGETVPEPGRPGAVPEPGRPGVVPEAGRPGAVTPEPARPAGAAAQPGQPAVVAPHLAEPGAARPEPAQRPAPQAPRPATEPVRPAPGPAARPLPEAAHPPAAVEAPRTAAPAPRPEPPRAAPVAPRPEPQRAAPVAPRPEPARPEPARPQIARPEPPHPEPARAAPPAPRPEPPRAAPPAPRPEPPRAAAPVAHPAPPPHPEPQEHKKPGEG